MGAWLRCVYGRINRLRLFVSENGGKKTAAGKMNRILFLVLFVFIVTQRCVQTSSADISNLKKSLVPNRAIMPVVVANFSEVYSGNISSGRIDHYVYSYNNSDRTAVRIFTVSKGSEELPTMFVIRQERSVMSWQIPLLLRYTYQYKDVSRTLCPLDSKLIHPIHHQQIFVEVSTQSTTAVSYSLKAEILTDFLIGTNEKKSVSSSPSNPVYYMYTFPDHVETVVVSVVSQNKLCAVLSIQETKCPVFDLDKDVDFEGQYQTVTTKGAITVDKSSDSDSFYVVLVVKPNDEDCTGGINMISPVQSLRVREKNFTLHVEQTLAKSQYYKAIFAAVGLFLTFYVAALFLEIYHGCKENLSIVDYQRGISVEEDPNQRGIQTPLLEMARDGHGATPEEDPNQRGIQTPLLEMARDGHGATPEEDPNQRGIQTPLLEMARDGHGATPEEDPNQRGIQTPLLEMARDGHGATPEVDPNQRGIQRPLLEMARDGHGATPGNNEAEEENRGSSNIAGPQSNDVLGTGQLEDSINSDDYDLGRDADHDKDTLRTKTAIFVTDLSRKSEERTEKTYSLYYKNLITIAIFYGLPVIQLVMTYQKMLNFTGNQDICYYNFLCSHRLGVVSAFNNVFSNIGYVLLGILFLILVYRRDRLHQRVKQMSEDRHEYFGISQHFDLYYAMGLALCVEGFMSACYHICPTITNYQFDTSFMYIMACLCILKIYQNRHTDISGKSDSAYFVMAIIIIVAVCGMVYGTSLFWVLFALVYVTASLVISIHLYYVGRWKIDRAILKRLYVFIRTDLFPCSRPMHLYRLVLLVIGNIVNWIIAIVGLRCVTNSGFASYLLSIFIVNLLLYTIFYLFSKCFYGEKIPKLTIALIVLSTLTWAFSLYFFLNHLTSSQLSPADSREKNHECVVLQFYDGHDVWHFLSAISLFFSFLVGESHDQCLR